MTKHFGSVSAEEHVYGDTQWIAIRARGAEWSWLTPNDALVLARHWMATYGATAIAKGRDRIRPNRSMIPIRPPHLTASAKAYLKAVGLVTTLLVTWAGLCLI